MWVVGEDFSKCPYPINKMGLKIKLKNGFYHKNKTLKRYNQAMKIPFFKKLSDPY
ncbi:hypothetical protein KVM48_04050 [Helicobacter pylori]|nr:hypothetical protein KVM48_04050 [Helicobacter pylori]